MTIASSVVMRDLSPPHANRKTQLAQTARAVPGRHLVFTLLLGSTHLPLPQNPPQVRHAPVTKRLGSRRLRRCHCLHRATRQPPAATVTHRVVGNPAPAARTLHGTGSRSNASFPAIIAATTSA